MWDSLVGSRTIRCKLHSLARSHIKVAAAQVLDGEGPRWHQLMLGRLKSPQRTIGKELGKR